VTSKGLKGPTIPNGSDQADSLALPLRRRLRKMARPPRVDMRLLKPWFLARLRTLGWKVLFTSEVLLVAKRRRPAWCQT